MQSGIVIDTLKNGNFVILDKYNTESVISGYAAFNYYNQMSAGENITFTREAIDEIQTGIENELARQEKLSQASYA